MSGIATGSTILIVDDSRTNQRLLGDIVERGDYTVRVATSGEEALEFTKTTPPDLILLDVVMPEMDGFEVCRQLRAREHLRQIPVLFVSAVTDTESKVKGFACGGVDFITKPYQEEEVLARIRTHLDLYQTKRALSELVSKQSDDLHRNERLLHEVLLSSPDTIYILNVETREIRILNRNRFCGYAKAALNTLENLHLAIHPDDRDRVAVFWREPGKKDRNQTESIEYRLRRSDGNWEWIQSRNVVLTRDEHGRPTQLLVTLTLITEQKRMERERRKSEERFHSLMQHTDEGFFLFEPPEPIPVDMSVTEQIALLYEGTVVECNEAMARMYGYKKAEDVVGVTLAEMHGGRDKSDNIEFMTACIKAGYRISGAHSMELDCNGNTVWFSNNIVGIVENGYLVRIWGTQTDITERKRLEAYLAQAQKMEAIGHLAGGIAHDFNNLLSGIIGFSEISLTKVPEGSMLEFNLQHVLKTAERARDLVKQILSFSRNKTDLKIPISIGKIVEEAVEIIRASLPATIEMRTELSQDAKSTLADATQIHEVVMNLCANATHSMAKRGVLEIRYEERTVDQGIFGRIGEIVPGTYAVITIKDTGCGMTESTLSQMFEPFFTTKAVGVGTGLGLSVVFGIVKNHGGDIVVESEIGKGTTFQVFFPTVGDEVGADDTNAAPLPGGTEHILIVDDEEIVIEVLSQNLTSLGYKVSAFRDGLQALAAFEHTPGAYDLAICNQIMPGLTGLELSQRLLDLRRDIPIVLCTGYSGNLSSELIARAGIKALLMKPILRSEIASVVRQVLDQS